MKLALVKDDIVHHLEIMSCIFSSPCPLSAFLNKCLEKEAGNIYALFLKDASEPITKDNDPKLLAHWIFIFILFQCRFLCPSSPQIDFLHEILKMLNLQTGKY